MKFKKISVLIALAIAGNMAFAQYVKDYRIEADKYYNKGDWQSAASLYEKFLSVKKGPKGSNDDFNPYAVETSTSTKEGTTKPSEVPKKVSLKLINFRIAECYKKLNNYKMAEPWFAKVVATDKASYPLSQYDYAVCLRALNKFDEAEKQLSEFVDGYASNDEVKKKAIAELANLKFINAQMKSSQQKLFVVNKMADDINTTSHGSNTAPFVSNSDLYFTSSRVDTVMEGKKKKVKYQNKLYKEKNSQAEKVNFPNPKNYHQGAFTFTPDGKTVFFSRWELDDLEANTATIYKSTQNVDGTWAEPTKLEGDINTSGYISKQPMLTLDGKYLLYASNKPGGQGGFDIWVASVEGDKVGTSKNLGTPVNTNNQEVTPFYHAPSKSLVFANEGRVGLGGYDLFSAKGDFENGFEEPKNLGYPVNSQKNDQYFFNNDDKFLLKNFYISSDRESDCCLELFTANKLIKKWVSGKVVDAKTGAPLSDVVINVTDEKGNRVPTTRTDKNGNYFFESNPYDYLNANANKQNYETSAARITGDFNIDTLVRQDWVLTPIPPPPPPIITEDKPLIVRFDFNKSVINEEFKVYLDTLAAMMERDTDMKVEIGGHTDQVGTEKYNLALSQRRADAAKAYMVEKYNSDTNRLTTKGYGKCCPLEAERDENGKDKPEARLMNRRLEFKLVKKGE
jgi:OmpA-OmpF porin, OOP family